MNGWQHDEVRVGNNVTAPAGSALAGTRVGLSVALPQGWDFKETWTLLAPDGNANVIMSSEPLDYSLTTEQYAWTQGDILSREFPGFREHSCDSMRLTNDVWVILRHFSWQPPDGLPITQLQLYHAANGRGATATATTTTHSYAMVGAFLFDILKSILVSPTAPATSPTPWH